MTKLEELNAEFLMSSKEVERIKDMYLAKKRELTAIETQLVEARENERAARDRYETYCSTYVIESSLDDWRREEIAAFAKRMPDVMATIAHEEPLAPVWTGTLDGAKPRR